MMSLFYFVGSIAALFITAAAAPTNVPVSIVQTRVSGTAGTRETTPSFNSNTFRDGGLSTNVNGYNLQVFQDSKTCKSQYFDNGCYYGATNFTSGTDNSLAYFGYVRSVVNYD